MLAFLCKAAPPVQAHAPYFGQSEKIEHPEFGVVHYAILYGDGVLFADPSQVVVFDSEGYLLAATPQSRALLIRCDRSLDPAQCQIYDELLGLIFEANYSHWARGRKIEQQSKPFKDAYPEYMDMHYGFTARPATFYEKLFFEVSAALSSPIGSALSVLWWVLAWLLLAHLTWKWKRGCWKLRPLKISSGALGVFSIVVLFVMSMLAAYGRLLFPYSPNFFSFSIILGGLIAAILTRPKEVTQRD